VWADSLLFDHASTRNPRWHDIRYPCQTGGLYLPGHPIRENFDFSAMLTKIPAIQTPIDDIVRLVSGR
jgi:hypothetical protein